MSATRTAASEDDPPAPRISEKTLFSYTVVAAIGASTWYMGGWASRITTQLEQLVAIQTQQGMEIKGQGVEIRSLYGQGAATNSRLDRIEDRLVPK